MDSPDKLNLKLDSSIRMAFSLAKLGAKAYYTTPAQLAWSKSNPSSHAYCAPISFENSPESFSLGEFSIRSLADFNGVHMRKDPPFDLSYISSTWILDGAPSSTKIINHPNALRGINEKLSIYLFEKYADNALLSSNPQEIMEFIEEKCEQDAIIKPLDLFGGKGVSRIKFSEFGSKKSVLSFIENECKDSHKLVQPFNKDIFKGEIRAFSVAGKPLSYCLKKPTEGSYLANTGSGATLETLEPSAELEAMIKDVSEKLLDHGVFIAGYDVIGKYISEINITSPRLLLPEHIDSQPFYDELAIEYIKYCES
jgi:glutathione synthase